MDDMNIIGDAVEIAAAELIKAQQAEIERLREQIATLSRVQDSNPRPHHYK